MLDLFKDKVVLITGHTGFKGAWLSEWMLASGARVIGYSLEPPSEPSLYAQLDHYNRIECDYREDIRNQQKFQEVLEKHKPEFIFHLAAQTLVGVGYEDPVTNYEINIMGTVNILESLRQFRQSCICVAVTTDKVYENEEWLYSYRENDPMGGFDPYSASKGCCELIISSYNRSYFYETLSDKNKGILLASVRAGNVIGGGDWAKDRIVPDCMRSLMAKTPIPVRNKVSTRPWQHVLEPLGGYILLAASLYRARENQETEKLMSCCGPFNFGPNISSNKTVADLVCAVLENWDGDWVDVSNPDAKHEAGKLNLLSDKAFHLLDWRPRWSFEETIKMTVDWYKYIHELNNDNDLTNKLIGFTQTQISNYEKSALLP